MNWTEPKPPTKGVSFYDHTILGSPLGEFRIEWKSWKDSPDYGIDLEGQYIGTEYSLEEAKELVRSHLFDMRDKLEDFLKSSEE